MLILCAGLALSPTALAQEGEALRGTLRGPDDKPVQGVKITVTEDGKQVGEAETSASGRWEIELPGPGTYDVSVDVDSLPEGLQLRQEGGETLSDVSVQPDQQRTVIFPLTTPGAGGAGGTGGPSPPPGAGEQDGGGVSGSLGRVAQLLVDGVKFGVIIAISAIGLSLIFGTAGLINFAHGEMVTLGAVVAFLFSTAAAGPGIQLIPAALLAVIVGGLAGGAMERGLWRPLRGRGTGRIQLFIISIGLSLLLRHVILVLYGAQPNSYADYTLQRALRFGPVSITPRDLIVVVLSFLALIGVGLMLQRTRIGKAMRAVSDNRDLAEASGIDVSRVILVVWVMGGMLAALGGVFYGLIEIVSWDMGFNLLLFMFAGVILGGLGTAYGAMVGSLVIGLIAQLSTLYFSVELQFAWALAVLILVLLVRPQGIFGRAERIG
ncbi:MAG: branched-chain amino acid ABC transporter permease [Streptosporangiales bacterium]|nr:branched-chain amino acid ABC transporter permease [Streptosporangiales bacterium]